jgi:hypothetical protein
MNRQPHIPAEQMDQHLQSSFVNKAPKSKPKPAPSTAEPKAKPA